MSEIINLKIKDIAIDKLIIHLKEAKGGKDRITIFPEKIKNDIINLMDNKIEGCYLFESEKGGKLTKRAAQKIFENALKKQIYKKMRLFTRFATISLFTYLKMVLTRAMCKNYSDIKISEQPNYRPFAE